jgi:hypothetical protein
MTEKFGWLYDPPTPFASKADWEANLKGLRKLAAQVSHPDLDAAIAEAEAFLREAPILSPARGVDDAEGCGSKGAHIASVTATQITSDVWLIEAPPSIAPRAEWEDHLESVRELATKYSSPDIDAPIARAEAILRRPPSMSVIGDPSDKNPAGKKAD